MRSFNQANGYSSLLRKTGRKLLATTAMTAAGLIAFSGNAKADNWTDHQVVSGGSITIDTTTPNTTNIQQNGHMVTVRGDGDINAGWTVNVAQPSTSAKYILYDIENDPTFLLGNLNANGEIYIFDQDGTIFGENSVVNVGSIITSTGFISNENIAAGNLAFEGVAGDGSIVIEQGASITVADAGLAAFVAPNVSNSGVINAKMGSVVMAAGETVTLDMYGDGLVEVAVDGELAEALIENKGSINAEGGVVQISAMAAKNAVDNVINMSGVVKTNSATVQGGKIIISGGNKGTVNVAGKLDASGTTGGTIEVTGQNVVADNGAVLDASGTNGGGTIHFGGDFQGGGDTPTSDTALVAETAILRANADEDGDGGEVVVWSDNSTEFYGKIEAKGGANSGNGGLVEVSGASLVYQGTADTTALNGNTGWLLLDPLGIRVFHSAADSLFLSSDPVLSITDTALNTSLGLSNVLLATSPSQATYADADGFGLFGEQTNVSPNDDNISVEDGTVVNAGANTLYFSTSTLNLYSTITGNVSGGVGSPFTPAGITLKDPTTVNVFTGASTQGSIQQGVDVAASGATVNVGAGTYVQTSNLTLGKALTLAGAQAGIDARLGSGLRTAGGAGETIIDLNGNRQVLVKADNVTVDGFEVKNSSADMIYANTASGSGDTNSNGSWDGIVVKNNIIHDGGDEGVQLRDTSGAILEYNNVFDTNGDALNLASGSKDGFIRFNEIYQTDSDNGQIYVYDSTNITVEGNYIHDTTDNDGIKMGNRDGSDGDKFVGNVLNNRIENVGQDGIAIYSSNSTVSGNEISGSGSINGAIHVQVKDLSDPKPTNVVIENNYIHDNNALGIRVSKASNLTIQNNTFANNTGGHVQIRTGQDASEVTLTDNSFDSSGPFAVINQDVAHALKADNNYWGSINDATVASRVSGLVDFSTYKGLGTDTDLLTTGFQGDSSNLYVTLLGEQTGAPERVQEGINLLADGSLTGGARKLNLNAGTYTENGTTVNKSMTLDGVSSNANLAVIKGTGAGNGITLAADDISLRYLKVDGFSNGIYTDSTINNLFMRNVNVSNNTNYGIEIHNNAVVDGMDLRNLRLTGNGGYGLRIRGSVNDLSMHGGLVSGSTNGIGSVKSNGDGTYLTNVNINDVTFTNNSLKAIYMEKLSDATLTDLDIRTSGTTGGSSAGIDINLKYGAYQNITLDGTKVRNSATGASNNAITVKARDDGSYAGSPATLNGLTITGSDIVTPGGYGITVGNGVDGVTLTGNTVTGNNLGAGILAYGGVQNLTVGGATLADGNTVSGFKNGIVLDGVSGATLVQNNTANGNTDSPAGRVASGYTTGMGVFINNATGTVNVSDNTVNNNSDGIRILNTDAAAPGDVVIAGNTTNNNANRGILIHTSNGVQVRENMASGNENGVWLENSDNSVVERNVLSGNTQNGVRLRNGSADAQISNNIISGNAIAGVHADSGSTGAVVSGNSITGSPTLINNGAGNTLNASGNYWGTTDQAAIAAKMVGSVDFTPYLASGTDTDLGTKGFQGDFSDVFVTSLGDQTGATSRIQEGVENLADGALTGKDRIVHVMAGTYAGNVIIDRSANIRGFQADISGNSGRSGASEAIIDGYIRTADNIDGLTINGFTINNQGEEIPAYGGKGSINLGNGVSDVDIINNIFDGQDFGGADRRAGIVTASGGAEDVFIKNNLFKNERYGVYVNPNAVNVDIVSNRFVDNNFGVIVDDLGSDTDIRGNAFINSGNSAVYVFQTLGIFNNNAFRGGDQYITYLNGAGDDILIDETTGNRFYSNGSFKKVDAMTMAELFALEDSITHKMDNASYGLVRITDDGLYVTSNTLGIQNAIDAATAGDTVNVDGSTYTEDLTINKALKLTGHGTTLQSVTAANLITVTAANVNIDPFIFDGLGVANYGINATGVGADGLVVDGNTFQNFNKAGVYVAANSASTGTILNNTFHGTSNMGVETGTLDGGYTLDITGNTIGSNASKVVHGIKLGNVKNATVTVTDGSIDSSNDAIDVRGFGTPSIVNLVNQNINSGDEGVDINTNINGTLNVVGGSFISAGSGLEFNAINATGAVNVSGGAVIEGNHASTGQGINALGNIKGTLSVQDSTITGGVAGIGRDGGVFANVVDGTVEILRSIITGVRGDGIELGAVSGSSRVTINDNTDITGATNGIRFAGDVTGASLIKIAGNDIKGLGDDGVLFAGKTTNSINYNEEEILITQNTIVGSRNGISFEGESGNKVDVVIHENTKIEGQTGDGVSHTGNLNYAELRVTDNALIKGNVDGVSIVGDLKNSSRAYVTGNQDIRGVTGNGIEVTDTATGGGVDVDINNNTNIHNVANNGIQVTNLNGAEIAGNTIKNVGNDGVSVSNSQSVTIDGNNIDVAKNGIRVTNGSNATVSNNEIDDASDAAIRVTNNNDAQITSNEVNDNGATTFTDYGILVEGGNSVDVDGNKIEETSIAGIAANNTTYIDIDDNIVKDGADGIRVEDGHHADIRRNNIRDMSDDGIQVVSHNDVDVQDNTVLRSTDSGITISNSQRAKIDGNNIDVAKNGIRVTNGSNATVSNNEIDDASDAAIRVANNNDAQIVSNYINDNGATSFADYGILVEGGNSVDVDGNKIEETSIAGIAANNTTYIDIDDNLIKDGANGIRVQGGHYADIRRNEIRDMSNDGIQVTSHDNVDVENNTVLRVKDDGIDLNDSDFANIDQNTVTDAGDNGIDIRGGKKADVVNNTISGSGSNGIDVSNHKGILIKKNTVSDSWNNGIILENSKNAKIIKNKVLGTTNIDGISLYGSNGAEVRGNKINDAGWDGIYFFDSKNGVISNNVIKRSDVNGISIDSSNGTVITGNTVKKTYHGNGIKVQDSNRVNVDNNTINNVADDGIDVNGGRNILIDNNFIGTLSGNIGDDGIDIDGARNVTISNNQITATVDAGIELKDTDIVNVLFNNIYENGNMGLWGRGSDNTNIVLSGNTFTDQDIHAQFESGVIDLTGDGNTFTGGRVGMRFASAPISKGSVPLSLVDDDGAGGFDGTIGEQTFDGQSQYYVELANGAFFAPGSPSILNALDSTYVNTPFGDFTPSVDYAPGFPLDVVAFMESKFYHFNDDGSLGLFFFPLLPEIDQEDIFNYPGANAAALAGLNVTILGLPGLPGNPIAVADITPFAGGEGADPSAAALNAIDTAAGGEEAGCWSDAMNAAGGGASVNFSYGGSAADLLNSEAGCGA